MDDKSFVFKFEDFEVSELDFRQPAPAKRWLRNPGRLVTKRELLDHVWGDVAVVESSLTRAMALLRKALDDDMRDPKFIASVPKAGYRFICSVEAIILHPVREIPASPSEPEAPLPIPQVRKRGGCFGLGRPDRRGGACGFRTGLLVLA